MVTITRDEYDDLVDSTFLLMALKGAGVDNWDGYDGAVKIYFELLRDSQ